MELKYWGISQTSEEAKSAQLVDKDDKAKQELRLVPLEVIDLLQTTPS